MDLKVLCCAVLFPIQIFLCVLKAAARLLMPQKRKDLGADVVLITGGGRGIGRHLAKEFAKQGAKKVATKVSSQATHELSYRVHFSGVCQRERMKI